MSASAPTLRARIHAVLEPADRPTAASRGVSALIASLILLSLVLLVVASTDLDPDVARTVRWIEFGTVTVFVVEYVLRVWTAAESPGFRRGGSATAARLRWIVTPFALIDLLAILPLFLELLLLSVGMEIMAFRSMRLLRLFRVAKLGRYSTGIQALGAAAFRRRGELLSAALVLGVLLFLSATLLYAVERTEQPDAFGTIPQAMWWAVATLTTVGYGDVVPITTTGRVLGSMIAILGIGVFALPAGILSAGLQDELARRRRNRGLRLGRQNDQGDSPAVCPHCGESLSQTGPARPDPADSNT